jgi:two-component system, response regulator YesN
MDQASENEIIREAVLIGEKIKNRIKVIANVDVAVGIGSIYSGLGNLNKSYNEANFALKKAGRDIKVIYFGSIMKEEPQEFLIKYPIESENRLIEQIKIGNMDRTGELAEDIISSILDSNNTIEAIKESLTEFIIVLKRTAVLIGISLSALNSSEMIFELSKLNSPEEISIWSKRNVHNIVELIKSKSSNNREFINKAFQYINRQFTGDITLESVAEEVGISPQYLSRIFKEKYGSNFINYITNKRMQYAKELLGSNSINIKDVSIAVGYGDSSYFCRIFKKNTGFSPKQYRSQKVKGEF